ncbi:MAG: glycoside hydrolase [Bacteroidota bacterium]|nr:glycoside hydrolase [Bacteroidota bacterium]
MMRQNYFIAAILLFLSIAINGQVNNRLNLDFRKLENTHDINLSDWGPYSKEYGGISHIPSMKSGIRFDVSVLPGFYRSRTLVPSVLFESAYYPWDINPDLSKVTYRYELEWKDKVFVDVTYSRQDSNTILLGMHCVNNTPLPQDLVLNIMGSVAYPEIYPSVKAQFPEGIQWINAINYNHLDHAHILPADDLVSDGWIRSEARSNDYIGGSAVAKDFGKDKGDKVSYSIPVSDKITNGLIRIRYRMKKNKQVSLVLKGLAEQKLTFTGTGEFEIKDLPFSCTKAGNYELTFESEGGSGIELNGFFVGLEANVKKITITPVEKKFIPEINVSDDKNIILKYPDVDNYYGIAWAFSPYMVREVLNDELDIFFRKKVQDHVSQKLIGNSMGHYSDVFLRPVELASMQDTTIYALICNGSLENVKKQISTFSGHPSTFTSRIIPSDSGYKNILPEGGKYVFSQKMMKTALMSNIVYPIYTQKNYIRHFTPGKCWNSLYTWDDGFVALGLSEFDPDLATQCLNTYTTPVGSQSAFIHHGSPVPVQMYAFFDLWNKTQSKELLTYFYPRLKQYYEFLVGKLGSSTTRTMNSNLLKTWDYFYNSGGWDDYPPQKAVHDQHLENNVTPVITTAQCIRVAKILRMAAGLLSFNNDIKNYDQDIKVFSKALQIYSWDKQNGYFSYVVHDVKGNPAEFFKNKASGENYNMGLDGAYPLLSGICTPEQQQILLDKIFSEKHMWTPSGICVVDQSASYYKKDGYWNGAVWMPHQWFMWKTMLDLGRADLAWKIAQKGLDIWKNETDDSYYTYEHFLAKTGKGAGWHQFSGLSSPVLLWFSAYYKPGTVTTGFEVMIKKQSFDASFSKYESVLTFDKATTEHGRSIIVCMNPGYAYKASFNGKKLEIESPYKGLLQISLPSTNKDGKLVIEPLGS